MLCPPRCPRCMDVRGVEPLPHPPMDAAIGNLRRTPRSYYLFVPLISPLILSPKACASLLRSGYANARFCGISHRGLWDSRACCFRRLLWVLYDGNLEYDLYCIYLIFQYPIAHDLSYNAGRWIYHGWNIQRKWYSRTKLAGLRKRSFLFQLSVHSLHPISSCCISDSRLWFLVRLCRAGLDCRKYHRGQRTFLCGCGCRVHKLTGQSNYPFRISHSWYTLICRAHQFPR